MSAPVDVLAVLDRAFGAANEHYDDLKSATDEPALGPAYQRACRYMAEHRVARAAVDELIAADLEFDSAFIQCRETINGDKEVVGASMHRWLAAQERRKIAIARVQGGAA